MGNVLREYLFAPFWRNDLLHTIVPRRTFEDVVLPPDTREALHSALTQIRKHDLLFNQWGLAERHDTGLGLAFNFAGPPGTGKTICAEAVAHELEKNLLVARYDQLESMWVGNTAKNVTAIFRYAEDEDAVLFFDEADAIASRRFTSFDQGYQREANNVISVLLREVEHYSGVVIFATNLARNFDPAFERRIHTHILFSIPDAELRERIWRMQLHAYKTPLAPDVDFKALATRFEVSGGDIKNAVLKAAQRAAAEPGPDAHKLIRQEHFDAGIEEVMANRSVMDQSLFSPGNGIAPSKTIPDLLSGNHKSDLLEGVGSFLQRLQNLEENQTGLLDRVEELQQKIETLRADENSAVVRFDTESSVMRKEVEVLHRLNRILFVTIFAILFLFAAAWLISRIL